MKLATVLFLFALTSSTTSAQMQATNLTCEHLVNPLGIDTPKPRFSWQLESDARDELQTAYQIIAAGVWDSGRVESDRQLHVEYAGPPLKSGQRCTWKVRVWDKSGNMTESEPATFEMGLLDRSDWHGKWIGRTDSTDVAPAPMLRKSFALRGPVKVARAYVCGLGYHELRINGKKVGDHLLDPGYTRFDRRVLYVTHDVTEHVKQGDNAIGVTLGNGWFNEHYPAAWNFHQAPWRMSPRLLLELRVTYADGSTETLATDETWKTSTGPTVHDNIFTGVTYDARLEKRVWDGE